MGITNSNKMLSTAHIDCGDSFQIRLSLTAAPDIVTSPTDIVLILDRSGSMAGNALENMKNGAKAFLDIIDEATDGIQDGQIGSGSRIAIVSFADTAAADTQLITSVADLKSAVDALSANGSTNHADAFLKASELLAAPSANARVMVMFTDGQTTAGPAPSPIAAAARGAGAVIYTIGLSGSNGVDASALEDWASKPSSAYVAITPDAAELEELFKDLARNIAKPGATNIMLTDKVSACFRITSVATPTKGTARLLDGNTVQWKMDALGVSKSEGATLDFTVEHIGPCSGILEVNESITYLDAEGNAVRFPSPELEVACHNIVYQETCPEPVELIADGCEDTLNLDAGAVEMESLGRIVQLSVTLQKVCPNRRIALAAILTEVDARGIEYKRGMKTLLIPAHRKGFCRDITVRCITFVLPEALDVSGSMESICNPRKFKARVIANYVDNDIACCNTVLHS